MCAKKLSVQLSMIRGSLGKQFCIKHYSWGVIKTRFPDMSRIIATERQRSCRNLFREAVAYAKQVIRDNERKRAWQKKLRRRNGVYNEAVKFYMLKDKLAKQRAAHLTRKLILQAFQSGKEMASIPFEPPLNFPTRTNFFAEKLTVQIE